MVFRSRRREVNGVTADSDTRPAAQASDDAAAFFDEGATPEPVQAPSRAARRSAAAAARPRRDPVVQTLITAILVVLVLALVTVAYALFTNVFGTGAPRSAQEQRLIAYKAKVEAGSTASDDWRTYISALIEDGQYGKAQEVIDKGSVMLPDQEIFADMAYMQAELYLAQGDLDAALEAADGALATIKSTYETEKTASEQSGMPSKAVAGGLVDTYWDVLLVKAEVLEIREDWNGALGCYDEYLQTKTTAASIFTKRGEIRERVGDTAGAAEDYRQTLVFIADDPDALAGLERIGASR